MDDVDRVIDVAEELIESNLYREALEILRVAATKYPDEPDVFYLLGCAALNERLGEDAFFAFSSANELCPEDADILSGLSDACLTMDRSDLAKGFVTRALALEPDGLTPQISYGHYLEKEERFLDAISHYQKLLYPRFQGQSSDLDNSYINARLGFCLMQQGMFEDAARELSHYLKENPNDLDWQFQLGTCYGHMGMIDEAYETFEYIVRANPEDPVSRAYLALSMAEKGWLNEAREEITIAIRQAPDNPRVIEIYEDIMGRDEDGGSQGAAGDLMGALALLLIIRKVRDRRKKGDR